MLEIELGSIFIAVATSIAVGVAAWGVARRNEIARGRQFAMKRLPKPARRYRAR